MSEVTNKLEVLKEFDESINITFDEAENNNPDQAKGNYVAEIFSINVKNLKNMKNAYVGSDWWINIDINETILNESHVSIQYIFARTDDDTTMNPIIFKLKHVEAGTSYKQIMFAFERAIMKHYHLLTYEDEYDFQDIVGHRQSVEQINATSYSLGCDEIVLHVDY